MDDIVKQEKNPKKEIIQDFTTGPVFKQLVAFSIPLFLGNLLQMVYNLVDMVVVGNVVGSVGISQVSVGGDVSNMLTMLVMGFANAAQVIIAQLIGADQIRKLGRFMGTFITFLGICVVVLTAVGLIFRETFLRWMSAPAEAWDGALEYSTVCIVGLVFIFGYNAVSSILRGLGDSRHPFMFIAVAAVLNIILDLLFVMVFKMGAFGAGLATVISQGISFVWSILFLVKNRSRLGFEMSKKDIGIDRPLFEKLLKLGIPMALKQSCIGFSRLFVNSFINSYGVTVSAVSGIFAKIGTVTMLVSNSLNTSGSTFVGQNIGAEKYSRVPKIMLTVFGVVAGVNALFAIAFLLFPKEIFLLFTKDTSILVVAMEIIPIIMLSLLGFAVRAPMNSFMNGSGNYRVNYLVAILDALVLRIGLSLLFGIALKMDYLGFFLGDTLAGFTPLVIGMIFYATGKWKTRKYIIEED